MTYFGVLLRFIGIPIAALTLLALRDRRQGLRLPPWFWTVEPQLVLVALVVVAVAYTTPWDNYLVANRIWWYDPALVTGIVVGYVPIEEYTFFVVQTVMVGLWTLFWMRRVPEPREGLTLSEASRRRVLATGVCGWVAFLAAWLGGWTRGLYLSILLAWALPPILMQLAFGLDILWRYRRVWAVSLIPPTLYLWVVDALAISGGTWTINPANTVGIEFAGVLPLEEAIFFLVTNILISVGVILLLARESHQRIEELHRRWNRRSGQPGPRDGKDWLR